jgi:putative membrane protein
MNEVNKKMEKQRNKKYIGIWICAIVAFLVIVGGFLGRYYFNWELIPYGGHMFVGGWMMPLGMIGMVCFWAFIISLVLRGSRRNMGCRQNDATQSLKDRLARGEITIEEYEKISKKIKEEN